MRCRTPCQAQEEAHSTSETGARVSSGSGRKAGAADDAAQD
ncbi:hypothetical protein L916_12504 [Phytophthora nicotianae]|uniref:Uncharacterized protein n=1 Tax=Phytophthora nicotianae TaxID=4792 RepID=W2IMJ4_PHYNI|nr:hypothetical protein L916_12504 [Phytophthora nicotianae]